MVCPVTVRQPCWKSSFAGRSGKSRLPWDSVPEHRIQGETELAHGRDGRHLSGLAAPVQTGVEIDSGRIVVGGSHIHLVAREPQPFVTDSKVLRELMHRYLATGRWVLGREVLRAFAEIMHDRIESVHAEDVLSASELADRHPGVGSRGLVHRQ